MPPLDESHPLYLACNAASWQTERYISTTEIVAGLASRFWGMVQQTGFRSDAVQALDDLGTHDQWLAHIKALKPLPAEFESLSLATAWNWDAVNTESPTECPRHKSSRPSSRKASVVQESAAMGGEDATVAPTPILSVETVIRAVRAGRVLGSLDSLASELAALGFAPPAATTSVVAVTSGFAALGIAGVSPLPSPPDAAAAAADPARGDMPRSAPRTLVDKMASYMSPDRLAEFLAALSSEERDLLK